MLLGPAFADVGHGRFLAHCRKVEAGASAPSSSAKPALVGALTRIQSGFALAGRLNGDRIFHNAEIGDVPSTCQPS